jgi:hypothetical protein
LRVGRTHNVSNRTGEFITLLGSAVASGTGKLGESRITLLGGGGSGVAVRRPQLPQRTLSFGSITELRLDRAIEQKLTVLRPRP